VGCVGPARPRGSTQAGTAQLCDGATLVRVRRQSYLQRGQRWIATARVDKPGHEVIDQEQKSGARRDDPRTQPDERNVDRGGARRDRVVRAHVVCEQRREALELRLTGTGERGADDSVAPKLPRKGPGGLVARGSDAQREQGVEAQEPAGDPVLVYVAPLDDGGEADGVELLLEGLRLWAREKEGGARVERAHRDALGGVLGEPFCAACPVEDMESPLDDGIGRVGRPHRWRWNDDAGAFLDAEAVIGSA
jgi:hypothetical protein